MEKKTANKSVPGTSTGSVKKKKKPNRGSKSATALTEVPTDVMTVSEAEKFHSRLETAAKHLRFNRTQVLIKSKSTIKIA